MHYFPLKNIYIPDLEIGSIFDGLARSELTLILIISIFFLKSDLCTIELKDQIRTLSVHYKNVIIRTIESFITSDNFNAWNSNMRDKMNHSLKYKSKMYSVVLQFYDDYHPLTRMARE